MDGLPALAAETFLCKEGALLHSTSLADNPCSQCGCLQAKHGSFVMCRRLLCTIVMPSTGQPYKRHRNHIKQLEDSDSYGSVPSLSNGSNVNLHCYRSNCRCMLLSAIAVPGMRPTAFFAG